MEKEMMAEKYKGGVEWGQIELFLLRLILFAQDQGNPLVSGIPFQPNHHITKNATEIYIKLAHQKSLKKMAINYKDLIIQTDPPLTQTMSF